MKVLEFHQFVILEKGPINTAVADLLRGNTYQVSNEEIEQFNNRQYDRLGELIAALKEENLILEIDE